MAGPGGINYSKIHAELQAKEMKRHYELRHLRRIRIILLVILAPIWVPIMVIPVSVGALLGFIEFLKDGPS